MPQEKIVDIGNTQAVTLCTRCDINKIVYGGALPISDVRKKLLERQSHPECLQKNDFSGSTVCGLEKGLNTGVISTDPLSSAMVKIAEQNEAANFELDKIISIE